MEGDSKQHEKRFKYMPLNDISIATEEPPEENSKTVDDNQEDIEYISRNKLLQDKYNENFHSHIISTNTVSIVAENIEKKMIDRTKLFQVDEVDTENSVISSDSNSPEIQFQKPKPRRFSGNQVLKESEKFSSKELEKSIAPSLSDKFSRKNKDTPSNRSGELHSSSSLTNRCLNSQLKSAPIKLQTSETKDRFTKKGRFLSTKLNSKRLQRRPTLLLESKVKKRISGPIKRSQPTLGLGQTPKAKLKDRRKAMKASNEEIEAKLNYIVNIEKAPYENIEEYYDDFLDADFDLEDAIIETKSRERKFKRLKIEWSGQDIISAYEPYQTNIIMKSLSSLRVYQISHIRPLYKIRQYLKDFIKSGTFENIMTLCVTLNTAILAIDHYGIDPELEKIFTNLNLAFTIIF